MTSPEPIHPAIDDDAVARLRQRAGAPSVEVSANESVAGPEPAAGAGSRLRSTARRAAGPVVSRVRSELDRATGGEVAALRAEVAELRAELARHRAEQQAVLAAFREDRR